MSNHFWKHVDGISFSITSEMNAKMGEGWTEVSYEEYKTLINAPKVSLLPEEIKDEKKEDDEENKTDPV
jgi:hypothetical protein